MNHLSQTSELPARSLLLHHTRKNGRRKRKRRKRRKKKQVLQQAWIYQVPPPTTLKEITSKEKISIFCPIISICPRRDKKGSRNRMVARLSRQIELFFRLLLKN